MYFLALTSLAIILVALLVLASGMHSLYVPYGLAALNGLHLEVSIFGGPDLLIDDSP